jgi:hypothetical protein
MRMRILKVALVVVVLAQAPFAVSLWRTRTVHQYLESLPRVSNPPVPFYDARGVIHVHSAAGGHSLGTYQEIIAAAKERGCAFVFITEHSGRQPLLARISDPKVVVIYGLEERDGSAGEFLSAEGGRLRLQSGDDRPISPNAAGVEVFNLHESAVASDTWFNRISFLYHRLAYSDLFFFKLWNVDRRHFRRWDAELAKRPITGIAGADAHQNVGLILQTAAGQRIFSVMVDPYRESFQAVSTHVMLDLGEAVTENAVVSALRRGAAYFAFEKVADSNGFSFHAIEGGKVVGMGATVAPGSTLTCQAPRRSALQMLRNGAVWKAEVAGRLTVEARDPGVYRVEVYLADAPSPLVGKPWIVSNPIFVRAPGAR